MVGLRLRLVALVVGAIFVAFVLLFLGVNAGLKRDVFALASQNVDAGADALNAAVDARAEQIRSGVLQAAGQASIVAALQSKNAAQLQSIASDSALAQSLSFAVVTDEKGRVVASSRGAGGSLARNPIVQSALLENTMGGTALLGVADLKALGIDAKAPQLVVFAATPVNNAGRSLGVVMGGQLFDGTMKTIDDVSRFTAGKAAVVVGGKAIATSMSDKDGNKLSGFAVPNAVPSGDSPIGYAGTQTLEGTEYFVKIVPLTGYDGKVVGAYWFGVPYAKFQAIISHTFGQIALWGTIGGFIALLLGVFAAGRIGRQIAVRSREVNQSAKELSVLVIGGEVSGGHVEQTREKLERIQHLADLGGNDVQLRALATEAVNDVIVIDTLSSEISGRMRDAAIRVERLSDVARELDQLVAGARAHRN